MTYRLLVLTCCLGCRPALKLDSWTERTGRDGVIEVEVEIRKDQDSFLIAAQGSELTTIERVTSPSGREVLASEDWVESDELLSVGLLPYLDQAVLNWPIRPQDGQLDPGVYTVEVRTRDEALEDIDDELQLDVFVGRDRDRTAGEVHVDIYWARGVSKAKVVHATEAAVAHFREILARQGLEVVEHYEGDTAIDPNLGKLLEDGSKSVSLLDKEPDHVVLLIGESYGASYSFIGGLAGGLPGSMAASRWSFVSTGWLAFAGVDGEFDGDEERLWGEVMAHEVGHYLGLAHPVQCVYDGCGAPWDAIADTPRCEGFDDCEAAVGQNLMFPFEICDADSCLEQTEVTEDQRYVMQGYTGVL